MPRHSGHASDEHATGGCGDANQKPRSHDTSRIAWAKLMATSTAFLGWGKPGRREQPAHESLSSRATLVEVPLTGLSFEVKKGDRSYVVEIAVPLSTVVLKPFAGLKLSGDFGATHGTPAGDDTLLRTSWNNQATGLVNDEVFELKMEPKNWGQILFTD